MCPRFRMGGLSAVFAVCLGIADAQADDPSETHLEFTMGFIAGEQDYTGTHFKRETESKLTLSDPFLQSPFDRVYVQGLRYEVRLVTNHVRMTAGLDIPFTSYKLSEATAMYEVGGQTVEVITEDLSPVDLHFGIGAEFRTGPLAAYADLVGGVHWTDASLLVDGGKLAYSALTFNFWARVGLRVHVRDWLFLATAGELGLLGDMRWGAELSVGFATP